MRESQEHLPSGVHARAMKGLRVGPEWEEARVRAWDEGMTLSRAMELLLEAYARRLPGYDASVHVPSGPSRSVRVSPELWARVRARAVSEGMTTSRAAARLLIGYARRELDLPVTQLVAPEGVG